MRAPALRLSALPEPLMSMPPHPSQNQPTPPTTTTTTTTTITTAAAAAAAAAATAAAINTTTTTNKHPHFALPGWRRGPRGPPRRRGRARPFKAGAERVFFTSAPPPRGDTGKIRAADARTSSRSYPPCEEQAVRGCPQVSIARTYVHLKTLNRSRDPLPNVRCRSEEQAVRACHRLVWAVARTWSTLER